MKYYGFTEIAEVYLTYGNYGQIANSFVCFFAQLSPGPAQLGLSNLS